MIEISDLRKTYPGAAAPAVRGLSLTVDKGEFLVLAGPSGCGKTTTLNMLNRLIEPSGGSIRIGGRDIREDDPVLLRRQFGYVFQDAGLFPHLTVTENIGVTPRLLGWHRDAIAARGEKLLTLMKLPELGSRLPRALSGGQRQRVALARALAAQPSIMLLDEPFGALDPLTRDDIADDYARLHDELGLTTIMVTHDMTEALLLADRIAVMRDGALVQTGAPRDLIGAPADAFVARLIETPRRHARRLAAALEGPEG